MQSVHPSINPVLPCWLSFHWLKWAESVFLWRRRSTSRSSCPHSCHPTKGCWLVSCDVNNPALPQEDSSIDFYWFLQIPLASSCEMSHFCTANFLGKSQIINQIFFCFSFLFRSFFSLSFIFERSIIFDLQLPGVSFFRFSFNCLLACLHCLRLHGSLLAVPCWRAFGIARGCVIDKSHISGHTALVKLVPWLSTGGEITTTRLSTTSVQTLHGGQQSRQATKKFTDFLGKIICEWP